MSFNFKKLIEAGKIDSFDKKELELVVALFEKDVDTLNKYQETKLSSKVGKLLLTVHASKAYKLDDLMQFINIIDVAEELLFTATYHQNINIIKQIIEAKIEISSSTLIKVLLMNFNSDNKEILDCLLGFKGLNINEQDENDDSLLDFAITFNKPDIVQKLLSYENIEVNKKNNHGLTPLKQAINDDKLQIVKLLLSCKSLEINQKNQYQTTPLQQAINGDKLEIVKLLLSHPDIKVNEKDQLGYTSLDWVIICNKLEIFKVLMPHLDINQKNQDGYTPLEWADIIGKTEIAEILRLHEAKLTEEVQGDSMPISNIELDTSILGGLEEDQESYGL